VAMRATSVKGGSNAGGRAAARPVPRRSDSVIARSCHALADPPAGQRLERERPQDEQVERAADASVWDVRHDELGGECLYRWSRGTLCRVRTGGKLPPEGRNMATLNIKNFPVSLYRKLKERARRQHRSMAQEVTHILEQALGESDRLSILELEGLGEELWAEVDAAEHVERERSTWD
jgi:plasmid stability protein